MMQGILAGMRAFVGLCLAVFIAIGIGIGALGATGDTSINPANAVLVTALRSSAAQKSAYVDMTIVVTVPSGQSETIDMSGNQSVENGSPDGTFTLQDGNLSIHEIAAADSYFINYGSAIKLPNGASWLQITDQELFGVLGVRDASSLFNGNNGDPSQILSLYGASSPTGVTLVGPATINGVATTEYRASVNIQKMAATEGTSYQQLLQTIKKFVSVSNLNISVWVDGDGLVRQIAYQVPETIPLQGVTSKVDTHVQLDLSDFGVQVNASPPPSNEVYQLPAAKLRALKSLFGATN